MKTVKFKFENGEEVKDLVTGLIGIIDCSSLWLNGCVRYSVQPKAVKNKSEKPESWWMDEQQLKKLSDGINKKITPKHTGGPTESSSNARM